MQVIEACRFRAEQLQAAADQAPHAAPLMAMAERWRVIAQQIYTAWTTGPGEPLDDLLT